MRITVQKAGYVPCHVVFAPRDSLLHKKIEYFNQRRVIADAQKDRLAQANTQAKTAKR
jgi:hypothetical protein